MEQIRHFEDLFRQKIEELPFSEDPAHDLLHFERVVVTVKKLTKIEKGTPEITVPAAWLHDLVNVRKDDPRRAQASRLSAQAALEFLKEINYPRDYFDEIEHAIEAHSFSSNITCQTLDAKIVQDADRLDGLGAIGIARCFATAGLLQRPFYSNKDPFCLERDPDDAQFTLDHFYKKLFRTAQTLQTDAGKAEGQRRVQTMKVFLEALKNELS